MFPWREPGPPSPRPFLPVPSFSPRVLNSWRALACALGHAATRTAVHATRRAATVTGVAAALLLGDAAAGTPAGATPSAIVAAAVTAAPKTKRKASTAAKTRARKGKTVTRTARRTSSRRSTTRKSAASSASRTRRSRATRRPRPAPGAPTVAALTLPTVDLPTLALAPDGAASNWEAALGATPAPTQSTSSGLAALSRSATSLLDGLVARARSQLGTRYVYGGAAPGAELDCSSFVRYVMEALDVRLPRTANQQARVGRPVPRDATQLRPGDLLTFGRGRHTSHVGIYLGEGRFIHASVKSGQVIETTIERNRSLFRRWQGARRLLAGTDSLASDADDSGG